HSNAYLVGWPPELRCERCARAFLDMLLHDSTTINDFCQQFGEARLASREPAATEPPATPPTDHGLPVSVATVQKPADETVSAWAAIALILVFLLSLGCGLLLPGGFLRLH